MGCIKNLCAGQALRFSSHLYITRCMIIVRHTHIIKKGEIYQKPKNFDCVGKGRPDFSFFFQKLRNKWKSGETCLATWKIRRVLRVRPSGL